MPDYYKDISSLGDLIQFLAYKADCHTPEALAKAIGTEKSERVSRASIARWFKNDGRPRAPHRRRLIRFFLEKKVFKIDDPLYLLFYRALHSPVGGGRNYNPRSSSPGILGPRSMKKAGWTMADAVKRVFQLDFEEYEELAVDNLMSIERWAPVLERYPDNMRILVRKKELIGYWHSCVFLPEFYEKIVKSGKLMEGLIEPMDDFDTIEIPGIYNLYIISIVIKNNNRDYICRRMLIDSFFEVINSYSECDVLFKEITANAYSREGVRMCGSFSMTWVCKHRKAGDIYSGEMKNILDRYRPIIDKDYPFLIKRYIDANLY